MSTINNAVVERTRERPRERTRFGGCRDRERFG
jgi:hypothetical protein